MKKIILFLLFSIQLVVNAQEDYWQQEVHYTINVSLNTTKGSLRGLMSLDYINHSPDTLDFIWFHIWPNAYKNNSTAFAKQVAQQNKSDQKRTGGWGFIDSLAFTVNGMPSPIIADPENIDIIKLMLPAKLVPGERVSIATPFYVLLPPYSSRMGYSENMFIITQWYPKPAVYDRFGWHPMPYLDQGEFYSEYGDYQVNITVPSQYVIAATGILQNEEELKSYKSIGKINVARTQQDNKRVNWEAYKPGTAATKTLSYHATQVHDFAWFADKDFIIHYDTLELSSGKLIDAFSFFQPGGNKEWRQSMSFIKDAVKRYSSWVGEYPYPVVNAVEGPANANSGGMEYPMVTLITSPGADKERLDAVIAHEVGHNWFYAVLGSNERDHAWMDEGINSYYQFRYEAEKYRSNSIFGASLPRSLQQKSTDEFLDLIYNSLLQINMNTPIETSAAAFTNSEDYGLTVYVKAAVWMYIMELSMGKENFEKAMHSYYSKWKFKHPYPEDLKAVFEESSGKGMNNLFLLLNKKGSFK